MPIKNPAVKFHCGQMSRGQTSQAVNGPAVKCHLRSSFPNLGCRSKIPRSNVTAVLCPAVKRHWRSMVPWSNVTCGQVFLILVADQKSPGQMSPWSNVTVVKCPAVKHHWRSNVTCSQVFLILVANQKTRGQTSLRSNVPRSNVTGGQRSRGQMSLEVKFF